MTEALSKTCTILNKKGLHARAAAKFVQLAGQYDAEISVTKDDLTVNGTSILGLMMLTASIGCEVVLEARGAQASEAIDAIAGLIDRRFDEE